MAIHPSAIIDSKAEIHSSVEVGPYAVIDAQVVLGSGCWVGPHVHLTGDLMAGPNCQFHAGSVMGDAPQDGKYDGAPTRCRIGSGNVFREHVTVHRSNSMEEDTVIGNENYFMAHAHVGHNCRVGHKNIFANGALLGGHVVMEDEAFLSGHCAVHQFVRIGRLAMMQGHAGLSKDLPPYMMSTGINMVCGLNTVGLRRAGLSISERTELKRLYHHLFSANIPLSEAVIQGHELFSAASSQHVLDFIQGSTRGICKDVRQGSPVRGGQRG